MDKKTFLFLSFFLVIGRISFSQVMYQALLIDGKDTLTMWTTFVTPPYTELKITNNDKDMSLSTCFSKEYFPIWKIENDSVFLIELLNRQDYSNPISVDLKQQFKERCIDNKVFASEITYQIEAKFYFKEDYSHYDSVCCLTIEKGIVKSKSIFKDKTEYINEYEYLSEEAIQKNTDWEHLPPIEVDRLVTVTIMTDDSGKIIKAVAVKNSDQPYRLTNIIKMQGEEVWQREALRQIKLIPKWNVIYKCGQVVNKEDTLEFLFSKPK